MHLLCQHQLNLVFNIIPTLLLYCDMANKVYSYKQLYEFTLKIFTQIGCLPDHAKTAAKALLSADLRGIDSHGIARLTGYIRLWEAKRINSNPGIKVIHETVSTAVVDGDRGLGLVVAPFSMKIAIEKAKNAGTGWVSVQNSNHFGIAAHHAMMALEEDMIGIAMTNASPLVAPTFSIDRMLGTNPICVAAPAGNEAPFVADFATTTAANGKLELLQRKNEEAPVGWIQDAQGKSTTDAHALKNGGALLPLGSDREHGSNKGYALGAIVDIFSAILSGANYAPWVPPFPAYVPLPPKQPGKGIGHFFGAIRIDAFRPASEFKKSMDDWLQGFRNARPIAGQARVMVPGDPEREMETERSKNGIELVHSVTSELEELASRFGMDFPLN
jgi:LDH2 family malate/lactate/ureidoglycolate dehydrogenase